MTIIVPLMFLATPATSSFHMPAYLVALFGKYLCFALLAVSRSIWCGATAAFFRSAMARFSRSAAMRWACISCDGWVRGEFTENRNLPDFMVFLNMKALPITWWGFNYFAYAMLMVVLVPGVFAFVFGFLTFRSGSTASISPSLRRR